MMRDQNLSIIGLLIPTYRFCGLPDTCKRVKRPVIGADESGIALIMVLWVMVIIIVVTFSFSLMVRTEVFSTLTFKDRMQKKLLAESGLQRGIMELYYRSININKEPAFMEGKVCRIDGSLYTGQVGDGYYTFGLTDESGKININLLTDNTGVILNNLLVNLGIDKTSADTIVDSILDWKDADNLVRLHGAEDDYYMSLPNPYQAKNANFDNLEELLYVKGMTPEILFGNETRPGLIHFLTIYSGTNKININAAPMEVLRALPFMSDYIVDKIITYRTADNTKKDGSDLKGLMPDSHYTALSQYIVMMDSGIYAIEATGYADDRKKAGYSLKAVVTILKNGKYEISYYQSPARGRQP